MKRGGRELQLKFNKLKITYYSIVFFYHADGAKFRESFLKVNVFYEDLNRESYSERPAVPVSIIALFSVTFLVKAC